MKYQAGISRPGGRPRNLQQAIAERDDPPWTIMEVCGGQTHTIVKYGIDELLPPRSNWSTARAARSA